MNPPEKLSWPKTAGGGLPTRGPNPEGRLMKPQLVAIVTKVKLVNPNSLQNVIDLL